MLQEKHLTKTCCITGGKDRGKSEGEEVRDGEERMSENCDQCYAAVNAFELQILEGGGAEEIMRWQQNILKVPLPLLIPYLLKDLEKEKSYFIVL